MKIIKLLTALIIGLFIFSGCTNQHREIINPDAPFQYFYGKTCPHCIEMNKYLDENDVYSLNIIEKKEVWGNKQNAAEFQQLLNNLGVSPEEGGVPFFYDKATKKHYIGVANIIPVIEAYREENNLVNTVSE